MYVVSYSGPVNKIKMQVMLSEKGEIRKIAISQLPWQESESDGRSQHTMKALGMPNPSSLTNGH